MYAALKHLKQRIVLLAFATSSALILIMLIILYVMMSVTYDGRSGTAAELISQAAVQSTKEIRTEEFLCEDLDKDELGDYVIQRDPMDVAGIQLHGTIKCDRPNALWYSCGGGIVVPATAPNGELTYFYQEYSFNKDVSEITIEFPDTSRFQGGSGFAFEESEPSRDVFMVSVPWWASSNEMDNYDTSIHLELSGITLRYKEHVSLLSHVGDPVTRSYSEVFSNNVPELVSGFRSFFLLTDKEGQLIEIGSMGAPVSQEQAEELLHSGQRTRRIDGEPYSYYSFEDDNVNVHVYLSSVERRSFLKTLRFASTVLGLLTALIVFFIISYAAKKIVEQLSISYEKQNQFIANASHELKTPITVISATTDILAAQNGTDKWLDTIKAQSDKMQRLLHEMLELTKINESIETKVLFKSFNVSELAESTILYFESRAYEEHRELISEIEPDVKMMGQEEKIEELMSIFLDNAIKYADEGAAVTMRLKTERSSVILTCSNPCKGFDAANADRLFERFYRSDESHSDEKEGFGLGLSIAQLIVLQHKGTIRVTYEDGNAVFTAVFPGGMQH